MQMSRAFEYSQTDYSATFDGEESHLWGDETRSYTGVEGSTPVSLGDPGNKMRVQEDGCFWILHSSHSEEDIY